MQYLNRYIVFYIDRQQANRAHTHKNTMLHISKIDRYGVTGNFLLSSCMQNKFQLKFCWPMNDFSVETKRKAKRFLFSFLPFDGHIDQCAISRRKLA